jgi:hypothetical protein
MRTSLKKRLERLEDAGFDRCDSAGGNAIHVGCSQCSAMVISGHAAHERGCPNDRQDDEDA